MLPNMLAPLFFAASAVPILKRGFKIWLWLVQGSLFRPLLICIGGGFSTEGTLPMILCVMILESLSLWSQLLPHPKPCALACLHQSRSLIDLIALQSFGAGLSARLFRRVSDLRIGTHQPQGPLGPSVGVGAVPPWLLFRALAGLVGVASRASGLARSVCAFPRPSTSHGYEVAVRNVACT